jgi:hypothetical protein
MPLDSITPRFYVYVLARPDGRPFYVGKGTRRRAYCHEQEARRGHKCYKCNVIRKLLRAGQQVQRYIVFTTDDEHEAYAYEQALIQMYGQVTLTNLTSGGEGPLNMAIESRAKISQKAKARSATPEGRARMVANAKRHAENLTPEERHAIGTRLHTPENEAKRLLKFRETLAARGPQIRPRIVTSPAQLAHLRRMSDARRGIPMPKAVRAKISATNKGKTFSAETRAKLSEARRKRVITPETRAKLSAALKGRVRSADFRAKLSTAKLNQSAETRAKNSAANKAAWVRRKAQQK